MGLDGAGNVCVAAGGVAGSDFIGAVEGACAHAVVTASPLTAARMIVLLGIFSSLLQEMGHARALADETHEAETGSDREWSSMARMLHE
jgi:hypothetical protein